MILKKLKWGLRMIRYVLLVIDAEYMGSGCILFCLLF